MASDPYVRIRQRVDEIIAEAKKSAKEKNESNALKSFPVQFSPEEKYIDLYRKKQEIKKAISELSYKEYYRLAQNEVLGGILYFSRLVCLGKDDEKEFRQGIILYLNEQYIEGRLVKAQDELKVVSFEDFLAGKGNELLRELDERPPCLSEKDYERICAWRTKKIIGCTQLEFGKLRENFKNSVKDKILTMDIVRNEIKLVENIFANTTTWKTPKLIAEIKKLNGMSGMIMPENLQEFHRLFKLFFQGNNLEGKLTLPFFEKAKNDIDASRISEMPVFCLSLSMYCRWLHHIATFKMDVFDKEESSFDNLFFKTFEEGIKYKDRGIKRLEERSNKTSMENSQYEFLLTDEFEKQRKILNNLEFPHYFIQLEDKEKLKNSFVNDCLRSFNIELPKEELRKAIMLNGNIGWLNEKLCQLKHSPIILPTKLIKENAYLLEVLCHMAPDTKTINWFLDCVKFIKEQISNDRISMYVINKNANCLFQRVLEEAKGNFKKSLERMDIDDRACFIANFIRELSYLETRNHTKCMRKILFFKEINHMMKNELSSAEIIHHYIPAESNKTMDDKKISKDKILTFGLRPGPRPYRPIVKAMCLRMNLVTADSTFDDIWEVFTAPDLSKHTKKIQLGLTMNILRKFIDRSKPWFECLSFARIEKCGLFISLNEGPVKAHTLYNSKEILAEDDKLMEEIFNAKYNSSE